MIAQSAFLSVYPICTKSTNPSLKILTCQTKIGRIDQPVSIGNGPTADKIYVITSLTFGDC